MLEIVRLDHLVLTVADIPATIEWYCRVLGFRSEQRSGRWALHFGGSKLNLHQVGGEIEPKAAHPTPGSADLCFITPSSTEDTLAHLKEQKIDVEQGPVERQGALGAMHSIYVRDPDGNLVEISQYL